ncbi:MAG TPA: hypothetical protein VGQ83_37320 [Polyangia bacterium]|jgi:hypothetical protein
MRRTLALLLLLLAPGCLLSFELPADGGPPPATGPHALQGERVTDMATQRTITATLAQTTAGNLLVAVASWNLNGNAFGTATDSLGNTYHEATQQMDPGSRQALAMFYAVNPVGGDATMTVTLSEVACCRRLIVLEYAGVATEAPLDQVATNLGTGAAATSGSLTTTRPGELLLAALYLDGVAVVGTPTDGFTAGLALPDVMTAAAVQAAPGPVSAGFALEPAADYMCHLVAFRPR